MYNIPSNYNLFSITSGLSVHLQISTLKANILHCTNRPVNWPLMKDGQSILGEVSDTTTLVLAKDWPCMMIYQCA